MYPSFRREDPWSISDHRDESEARWHPPCHRNSNFVPRRCGICWDAGVVSDLFDSRNRITEHTAEIHGCYYNPYGDRYVRIPPDQVAEGHARKVAKRLEKERRCQLCYQQEFIGSEVITAGSLPPLGCATTIHRVEAVERGDEVNAFFASQPPKGRGRGHGRRPSESGLGPYLPPALPA